jgi:hypothetical protein
MADPTDRPDGHDPGHRSGEHGESAGHAGAQECATAIDPDRPSESITAAIRRPGPPASSPPLVGAEVLMPNGSITMTESLAARAG